MWEKSKSLDFTTMLVFCFFTAHEHYYRDCYDQLLQNGRGSYTFYNVIEEEQLLEEWRRAYEEERYKKAYMENAMIQLGVSSCEMEIEIEELRAGKFLNHSQGFCLVRIFKIPSADKGHGLSCVLRVSCYEESNGEVWRGTWEYRRES